MAGGVGEFSLGGSGIPKGGGEVLGSEGGHGRMGVDTTGSKAMSRGFMQV